MFFALLFTTTSFATTLNDGLLHYYKLDETSGNILDSVDGNTLTTSGSPTQNVTGKINKAIEFAHANDSLASIPTESKQQTMNAWIYYKSSLNSTNSFFSINNTGTNDLFMSYREYANPSGTTKPSLEIGGATITTDYNIPLNSWHMITWTWNGTTDTNGVKIYVDGIKRGEGTSGSSNIPSGNGYFGQNPDAGNTNSDIVFDEVGYWNRQLSAGEVIQLYFNGNGQTYPLQTTKSQFNYNINRLTQKIELTDQSTGAGTTITSWQWDKNGTTISTDQNTLFSITQFTDYNVCLKITDNNSNTDTNCQDIYTGNLYGALHFQFYDENTGAVLTGVSVDYNGTPQVLSGNTYDQNLQGITTTNYTYTFSKTGYGTRYYQTDLNQYTDLNKQIELLPTSLGQQVSFRFFYPDQSTKISEQYIEPLDYNSTHYNYSLGRFKTTSQGDINFFLNLNDANIHFNINNGQYDYNTIILTVYKPKDEDTGQDINAPWTINLSGLASQSIQNTTDASKVFALYSNTVDTYRIQIDANITPAYTSRTYLLNYLGNPLTATLQPYLLLTSESVLTKISTLQQTSLGITSLPNITVKVYKNVPFQGQQLIQQAVTDWKGQAALSLKTGDTYYFNLYQSGVLLAFNQATTIPINVITTTVTFTVSQTGSLPPNANGKGVFVTWIPLDTGLVYKSTGTFDTNTYFTNNSGQTYSIVIKAYLNGVELNIPGTIPYYANQTSTSNTRYLPANIQIPWSSLAVGNLLLTADVNQSDGNRYTYSKTYQIIKNTASVNGTGYTFDIISALRIGLRSDLGYNATEVCPPLIIASLIIIFGSLGVLTVTIGSFGGQGSVGMALAGFALFTFLNWLPLELTAIVFILGVAFIINDSNMR